MGSAHAVVGRLRDTIDQLRPTAPQAVADGLASEGGLPDSTISPSGMARQTTILSKGLVLFMSQLYMCWLTAVRPDDQRVSGPLNGQSSCSAGVDQEGPPVHRPQRIPSGMWSGPIIPKTITDHRFRWSGLVWSPPPESNRRPHPYHG
jgi:hypothetical protein